MQATAISSVSSDSQSLFSGSQDDSLSDSEDRESSSTTPSSSSPHEIAVRKRKRMTSRKNYFEGQARHPYHLRKRLDKSF